MRTCLDVFARMLHESRFESDRRSFGLEIELNLTDEAGDPALLNAGALEAIADADFQTEIGQFNIEINVPPRRLEGEVFTELEDAVRGSLNHAEERARTVGAHMMMIGILPTVGEQHLTAEGFSAGHRYSLLNEQIFAARGRGPGDQDQRRRAARDLRRHDRPRGRLHERAAASPGGAGGVRELLERGTGDRRPRRWPWAPTRRSSSSASCGARRA